MNKQNRKTLLVLMLFGFLSPAARASMSETGSVTALSTNEGGYGSAIIDPTGGFAYFGSSSNFVLSGSSYSLITPITLSPFGVNAGVHYFATVTDLSAAVFDTETRFAYFASSQAPSAVQAISLSGAISNSSMTFAANQNWIGTAVIDSTKHLAYFGTQTSPSMVIKMSVPDGVNVTSMTLVSSITLPAGLDYLTASVIDTQNGFAYFASSQTPGAVAKIQLSDFTQAAIVTFNSGEGGVASAVIDVADQVAFFGTHDSPGKVVKVNLSNFTRDSAITLNSGEDDLTTAILDTTKGFAYFGTNTSPGKVIRVLSPALQRSSAISLGSGENFLRSSVLEATNGYAFFGTFTTPGQVIQLDLLAGAPEIQIQPSAHTIHAGEIATFSLTASGRNFTYQWQKNGLNVSGATSASYSFTTVAADDGSLFTCVVTNASGSTTSRAALLTILPVIRVFPNPWRSDRHAGVSITFDGLLSNSTIKIFNLAAHWVKTLSPVTGTATWDRTNDAGQAVASGYYFYLITTGNDKQTVRGKLAIIR